MADPTGKSARQQEGPGPARRTLKTAQGKTFRKRSDGSGRRESEAEVAKRHKSGHARLSIVLGRDVWRKTFSKESRGKIKRIRSQGGCQGTDCR